MTYKIDPESWVHIQALRQFNQRADDDGDDFVSVWGRTYAATYAVYNSSRWAPILVWWKGMWIVNEAENLDVPMSPVVLATPDEIDALVPLGTPRRGTLVKALRSGALPKERVPEVVAKLAAARIGVQA